MAVSNDQTRFNRICTKNSSQRCATEPLLSALTRNCHCRLSRAEKQSSLHSGECQHANDANPIVRRIVQGPQPRSTYTPGQGVPMGILGRPRRLLRRANDTVESLVIFDPDLLRHSCDSLCTLRSAQVLTMRLSLLHICCTLLAPTVVLGRIDRYVQCRRLCTIVLMRLPLREKIVSRFNIIRTSLIDNETTPLQVGNGNFAFNVDNTGLQVCFALERCLTTI